MPRAAWGGPAIAAWLSIFVLAALLNAGGYRFGASDQAFYVPAVAHHADPSLFPRDWAILGQQDELNAFTPLAGWVVRALGVPLPALFLALHLATLALLGMGALALGGALSPSRWTAAAILSALALRHAVALGAVNTLEGYMHPRVLAFALGTLAIAALLRRRPVAVVALVGAAFVVHPTTAVWFGVMAGTALMVAEPRWRPWVGAAAVAALLVSAWAVSLGPLAPRMVRMDPEWLSVLQGKRYLFPDRWPASAWAIVALYAAVIGVVYRLRSRAGLVSAQESGVAAGVAALLAILAASLPFSFARVAFAVQLQVPRVLWLVDLVAVVYVVWWLVEGRRARPPKPDARRRSAAIALVILALALARGSYVTFVEHPERAVLQADLPATAWNRALGWIADHTPAGALVLADPGHAWRHGTSVRVGARRDVVLEEVKDSAMAMYSREIAVRVLDRVRALADFESLTAARARALAARYGAGVLVTTHDLDLPLLHREGSFRIYATTEGTTKNSKTTKN